jgi:hypothetical protein
MCSVASNKWARRKSETIIFVSYDTKTDWRLAVGAVENSPAILVYNPQNESPDPDYFIMLEIQDNKVTNIRDYRYAAYVVKDAKISDG